MDTPGLISQIGPAKVADPRQRALEVARQFEQVFAQLMVANLRSSSNVTGEEGGMFGSGPGSETYAEWFDANLSSHLAKDGGMGIADVIMQEFERWKQVPPAPPDASGHRLQGLAQLPGGIDVTA